jgi:hypothetical protein
MTVLLLLPMFGRSLVRRGGLPVAVNPDLSIITHRNGDIMNSYWTISATVTLHVSATKRMRQVPTFYLHPNVQGILDKEHAKLVALDVIDPVRTIRDNGGEILIYAVQV